MLTPTDLLAAGFRFFHPEHHGARPLYQRIETGPSGDHINIEDYEAALRSTGGFCCCCGLKSLEYQGAPLPR